MKRLFSESLNAAPDRLHMAAHSHHLWPDASRVGQMQCWDDAARLADRKWGRIMGEVWPEAAAHVAAEMGIGSEQHDRIVFAANTHDFIVRLIAACPRGQDGPLRILTSSGEFHSARRQFDRYGEEGVVIVDTVDVEPFDSFPARFADAAAMGRHDMIFVSQMLFGTGRLVDPIAPICDVARPDGPWVVIDGYHSFMAIPEPFAGLSDKAFFLGGGYKYAMAGEGLGFMSCPPGFGPRPPVTGWFAEFEDLTLPPGIVGYATDAMRFMGATFDASALYRWNAIRAMLAEEGLTTAQIGARVEALKCDLAGSLETTCFGQATLINPPGDERAARFLAYSHADANAWSQALMEKNVITDVRGDVIRLGLGLYHDAADMERFAEIAATL